MTVRHAPEHRRTFKCYCPACVAWKIETGQDRKEQPTMRQGREVQRKETDDRV